MIDGGDNGGDWWQWIVMVTRVLGFQGFGVMVGYDWWHSMDGDDGGDHHVAVMTHHDDGGDDSWNLRGVWACVLLLWVCGILTRHRPMSGSSSRTDNTI